MKGFTVLVLGYLVIILGLFLYSYTQVDLSLTFSKVAFLRFIISSFQHVGYFERPLSAWLYSFLIILLSVFYIFFIRLAIKKKLEQKTVWFLIIASAGLLTFAYNAFSYDIFNYIFDAKIITHYHANPYLHKALDYPHDPMLSFMRWTHRVYPYGPVWLVLTVPLSFIGKNIFIVTFILFKLLASISFIYSAYFIRKISEKVSSQKSVLPLVLFAFNPLIIIESLVSGHIDIVMLLFALWGLYCLFEKKYVWAVILLLLSIGIKFVTVFLVPLFIAIYVIQRRGGDSDLRQNDNTRWFVITTILMIVPVVLASLRANFQVWYLLTLLPFAFLTTKKWVWISSVVFSILILFLYVPFLNEGDYNPPIPQMMNEIIIGSCFAAGLTAAVLFFKQKKG